MPLSSSIFNTFFRSNGVMLTSVFAAAFGCQVIMDTSADRIWDNVNKGRQWKDIKYKYMQKEEEDE